MSEYTKEMVETFLANQDRLFDWPVADTYEEAEDFLEEVFAVSLGTIDEVRDYLEGEGMDAAGLSDEEVAEMAEVFELPSGGYLVVQG